MGAGGGSQSRLNIAFKAWSGRVSRRALGALVLRAIISVGFFEQGDTGLQTLILRLVDQNILHIRAPRPGVGGLAAWIASNIAACRRKMRSLARSR